MSNLPTPQLEGRGWFLSAKNSSILKLKSIGRSESGRYRLFILDPRYLISWQCSLYFSSFFRYFSREYSVDLGLCADG